MLACMHLIVLHAHATAQIPVRWCAPEVLQHHKYSQKSDVWSYGILVRVNLVCSLLASLICLLP